MQFQRGLSDVEFDRLYDTEDKCREALFSFVLADLVLLAMRALLREGV